MQQSIEILMLPMLELTLAINQELQTNPLLEVMEEPVSGEGTNPPAETPENREPPAPESDFNDYNQPDDDVPDERPISVDTTLEEKLFRQLHFETSDPLELRIGEFILGNLDENGYLTVSPEEIALALQLKDTQIVERVRKVIQNLDPLGVASRSLKECLLIQIDARFNGNGALARTIIESYLTELSQKKFALIARKTGINPEAVKRAAQDIASLEPRPARNYRPLQPNTYIKPDVCIVHDKENGYQIQLNEREIPRMRVNPMYRDLLNNKTLQPQEREFINERLKNAVLFIKSVEQRGQTLRKIAQFILDKQTDFFDHDHMSIRPMTLKDVAGALGRNESTISRAIHNKYIDTPHGLFPIKFFFSQAIQRIDHDEASHGATSSRGIKEEIKDIVEQEDKNHPLSDQDIQEIFERKGMQIARRTISKYRQALHILPSHLRKE